jgi:polysaccharide pyruvyl transferase WcaK-like protein
MLIRIARLLDKPVVILGQTIGPSLDEEGRERLAEALPLASVVGVRGRESADLVRSLGVDDSKLIEHLDDAWFLNPAPSSEVAHEAARHDKAWIAVTLAPLAGDPSTFLPTLRSLGRQLSELARTLDADLVFLPHWNASIGRESDAMVARRLFGFLEDPQRARLLPVYSGEDTCWLTRQADLVVSTRYHPIVFAVSGGVPCLAIFPDEHTRVRHVECLRQAGLEQFAIPFETALEGGLVPAALSSWQQREATRRQLESRADEWRIADARKWSRVTEALGWPNQPIDVLAPTSSPPLEQEPVSSSPLPYLQRHARSRTNVSAVVLTKNGASRLERCLQSIAVAGMVRELVVFVDDATTDESESIARRFTPSVQRLKTAGLMELSLSHMVAACSGEYVLRVDDDETLGGQWDVPVDYATNGAGFTHFQIPRRWLTPGEDGFISSGDWFPDLQLRLFRNDPALIRWPSNLHEHMTVEGPGGILWDRWINHHVLWQHSRAEREQKAQAYQRRRPDKHLSHFYLWEEQAVRVSPTGPSGSVVAPLVSGETVEFGSGGTAAPYMLGGWSQPEPWGTWTDGDRAVLRLPLTQVPRGPVNVVLEADAFIRPDHPVLRVSVSCEQTVVAELLIDTPDSTTYSVSIPERLTADKGALTLSLNIDNAKSPRDFGESTDVRRLGLGVRRLRLDWA